MVFWFHTLADAVCKYSIDLIAVSLFPLTRFSTWYEKYYSQQFIGVESWIVMVQPLLLQCLTGFSDSVGYQINEAILDYFEYWAFARKIIIRE
ncbi:hypothetical protein OUZ56_028039 [Daphnia magna]|uniref:Uncharacterized protein n=1 Tax=Daphnia magna TaxID=35525 RepID=A0ABR0B2P8_9CRUS|nr:hypothetical protein OUZ56_028039 [Daphnia magna]